MQRQKKTMHEDAKLILLGIAIVAVLTLLVFCQPRENKYYAIADKDSNLQVINSCDLTIEELQSRNGKLIIEVVIGQVDNFVTGAGHQLDNPNYYISYSGVDDISNGNIICTYFIYNPENNYEDYIMYRYDYIIDAQIVDVPPVQ